MPRKDAQETSRARRWLARSGRGLAALALGLVRLPFRVLLVAWALITRFFLLLVTTLVCLYFVATTVITGPLVFDILNEQLLGTFHAEHVEVSLLTANVQMFNVRVTHPGGRDVVEARRVETSIDLAAMAFWGAKQIVGVSAPAPVHLHDIRVDGYTVLLPFDAEGSHFQEAFMPAVVTPDEGPDGPPPEVMLSRIRLGPGRVKLEFEGWEMPVTVRRLDADLRIRGESLELSARGLEVESFAMPGLLPEPVAFAGEVPSQVYIERVFLDLNHLEAEDARVSHPALDARIPAFEFRFDTDDLPVTARASVHVRSPDRVEEVTAGHVAGVANVDVEMFGSLAMPDFRFHLEADRVAVDGLELEAVEATATLDLHGGVWLSVPSARAELDGAPLRVEDGQVDIAADGMPEIAFEACFDGLRPALAALPFVGPDALPFADVVATGCCHGCRILTGEDEPALDGTLSVVVDTGTLRDRLGLGAGEIQGYFTWRHGTLRWEGLLATTDVASVSSVGHLRFEPELAGRVDAGISVFELAELPLLGTLGLAGELTVEELLLDGSLSAPEVRLVAHLDDFGFAGETFETIDFAGHYAQEEIALQRFCFTQAGNAGCLQADASLAAWGTDDFRLPFQVRIDEPLRVNLAALPWISLPVTGTVQVGPAEVAGEVGNTLAATLASVQLEAELVATDLTLPETSLARLEADIRKGPGTPGVTMGPVETLLSWETLRAGALLVQRGTLEARLEQPDGLWSDPNGRPFTPGEARIEVEQIRYGDARVSSLDLDLAASADPRRVDFKGRTTFAGNVDLRLGGDVLLDSLQAGLRVETRSLPVARLPKSLLPADVRELLAETVVAGDLALRDIDLASALAGDWGGLLRRLTATGKLSATGLERLPEPVVEMAADFSLRRGALHFAALDLALRNDTRARLRGTWWPFEDRLAMDAAVSATRLSSLRTVAALQLPLDATVAGEFTAEGPLAHLQVQAGVRVRDMVAAGIELGEARLTLSGRVGEKITLDSDQFFPGFTLRQGALGFAGASPDRLYLALGFESFELSRVLPSLPETLRVVAAGDASVDVRFQAGREPFTLVADAPAGKLKACLRQEPFALCMENPAPARIEVTSEGIRLHQVRLAGGGHALDGNGAIGFVTGWDLDVGLALDIARIELFGEFLASYSGRVGTGKTPLHLTGALEQPRVEGIVGLVDVDLQPRQLGSEITIPTAALRVSGELLAGNLLCLLEEDRPIQGSYDEGTFSIHGWMRLAGWLPDSGLLNVLGKEIYYQSPGQFRLVLSPDVEIAMENLQSEEGGGHIRGDVYITEGEFTRNFDRLIGSFTTAFSRSQERYSKPITEILPFLENMRLDLRLRGGNFAVSSRFPFGETELAVNLDLRVKGTLDDLQLYDWMHLVPGGTITYKVVKRVFSVTQGSVDFSGDPTVPYIDIEALTEVPYSGSNPFSAANLDEQMWGQTVPIRIRLTGTYPNLTPEFSSDKAGFDDADLQSLLLLGMTRKDLEDGSAGERGADISINLLTEDVADMVSGLLLAPFVDTVSLGFTQEGGILAEAATKIGRAISLSTRVRQDSTAKDYSAGIQFRITDRLSLEGRMKRKEEQQNETQTGYEAKFRYVIPLD